jgi:hypothetical protein
LPVTRRFNPVLEDLGRNWRVTTWLCTGFALVLPVFLVILGITGGQKTMRIYNKTIILVCKIRRFCEKQNDSRNQSQRSESVMGRIE